MAHGESREGKWRGNWRMEWVAFTIHSTSEHGASSITTADAHTSAASSRLNWRPRRFKWTRPFCRKTKSGFCACAITFQMASNKWDRIPMANKRNRPFTLRPTYIYVILLYSGDNTLSVCVKIWGVKNNGRSKHLALCEISTENAVSPPYDRSARHTFRLPREKHEYFDMSTFKK